MKHITIWGHISISNNFTQLNFNFKIHEFCTTKFQKEFSFHLLKNLEDFSLVISSISPKNLRKKFLKYVNFVQKFWKIILCNCVICTSKFVEKNLTSQLLIAILEVHKN